MSSLLTVERAHVAVLRVRTLIEALMKTGEIQRKAVYVVILDPGKTYGVCTIEEAILHERWIGEKAAAEDRFMVYARSKAHVCWRTGLDSIVVQQQAPQLYLPGDVKYGGGVIRDRLVVAASGLEWHEDQMCAEMVASNCKALCIEAMGKVLASNERFLPH